MDRRTDWIVRNGTLAVALYFGIVEQVSWLAYGIAAYAWWTLAAIVWMIPGAPASRTLRPVVARHRMARMDAPWHVVTFLTWRQRRTHEHRLE